MLFATGDNMTAANPSPGTPTEGFCFEHPLIHLPPDYDRMAMPFPTDEEGNQKPLVSKNTPA